jgi:stage V sporulation protein B
VLAILAGGAVSESFSLMLNLVLYLVDKRHFQNIPPINSGKKVRVAAIAMPVAISAYIRSGLLAIEHILIPRGLISYGAGSSDALAAYGSLHSMALPVVLFPAAILSSFAGLLIPEVTEQQAAGNRIEIRYIASRVYQMTMLFSIGAGAIMLFLSGELGEVLYGSAEVADFIRFLAPLVPIMYLDTATDAMLKGLGEQVYSMNVNILDALVSVISVALLVPRMGIMGYLVTIYITEILNAALSITRLLHISGFRPKLHLVLLRPLASAVGATCLAKLLLHALPVAGMNTGLSLTVHIFLTSILYFILLYLTGGFGKKDTAWLIGSLSPAKRGISP